ncbi:MAG: hypothetical protein AB2A00_00330 [Myxococcota bacterium]
MTVDAQHGLYLRRDGTWLEDGEEVTHPRLAALLHRSIARAPDGSLVVTTGRDVRPIACEDLPLRVLWVDLPGDDVLLHLSNERTEPLKPESLLVDVDDSWRCLADGNLGARFTRAAQLQLAEHVTEESGGFVLRVGARTLPLRAA